MDDGLVNILVSYEDETGKVFEQEFTTELFVSEAMMEDMDMGMEEMPMEEEQSGFPMWIIFVIVGVVVVAVVVVIIVLKKKSKKKKQAQLLIEDLSDDDED